MGSLTVQDNPVPTHILNTGDNAYGLALVFENGPLFNMQFERRLIIPVCGRLANKTKSLKLRFNGSTVTILTAIGVLKILPRLSSRLFLMGGQW